MLLSERQAQIARIVSKALLDHQRLRMFTNNLNIAMLACTNPTFEATVAGGRLRNEDRDVIGAGMEALFLENSDSQLIVCKGDLSP